MKSLDKSLCDLKVAIVHEWLVDYSGSERVLEQIINLYPQADLFSVVEFLPHELKYFIKDKKVQTTFIQNLPGAKKNYRNYLPLMPLAIEQLDLSAYDLVLSSAHAVSKGVLTGPNQIHISYIHSPMRYAWDLQHQYLTESGLSKGLKGMIARLILHYMRLWDLRTVPSIDHLISNSDFIRKRIEKIYRRSAEVIYPPVNLSAFELKEEKEDFYLTASRFVPYKKIDLIVSAFNRMPEKKLIVIGDGPDFAKIKGVAGSNVELLGFQTRSVLCDHMQRAKAFVFAAEEDFGITPVEAQACGTPVIAFGRGGSLETVCGQRGIDQPTGIFFYEQTEEALIDAIKLFEKEHKLYSPTNCRKHAENFSEESFRDRYRKFVESCLSEDH
ncbi:MAG: glycosyltransferase family 4 protein [Candidatus Caenarcaniphilales bacterium]|nr:glycosyltransferase family 4 protein [Candidatus Caenarcaniphilales bacterium]